MKRESFQSRLGFLLVSAGCAIGLGNVERFPYIVGQYGGAAFVLIYLVFLVIIFLLVEKIFTLSIIVSQLEDKIGVLSAEVALRSKAENKKIDKVDEKETLLEREEVEKQEIEAEIGIGEGR